MHNSNLVKCIECGSSIAKSAKKCPKCGEKFPHGVSCLICNKILKKNQALIVEEYFEGYDKYHYHLDCVNQMLTIQSGTTCSDCGLHLDNSILHLEIPSIKIKYGDGTYTPSCPNCGSENVLREKGACCLCHLPLYSFHRIAEGVYFDYESGYKSRFFHHHCVQHTKKEWVHQEIQKHTDIENKKREKNSGCFASFILLVTATITFGRLIFL